MIDFKSGGCYCIKMLYLSGIEMLLIGEYVFILVNEQLFFFWVWEDNMEEFVMIFVDVYFEEMEEN